MKPKIFVVFGMPRAGTTYLYHILGKHPSIFMPYRKEHMYFSVNHSKGEQWFSSLYSDMSPGQIGADIDPRYYIDNLSIDRILKYDAEVKIIFGVRHPVSFAKSLHGNIQTMGWNIGTASEMCEKYKWQIGDSENIEFSLTNGFLSKRIIQLQESFEDRLFLYDFAYFQESPIPVIQAIENFLSLPKFFDSSNVENIKINATARKNIPVLNWLLTQQKFLDFAYSVTPKYLVRKGRSLFDRLSVSKLNDAKSTVPNEADLDELQIILKDDIQFYEKLFSKSPLLYPTNR